MTIESAKRVLIGAETYIAGPYHFVKNHPLLVQGIHLAYIDSLETPDGDYMFEEPAELEFIDGDDELAEVGLVDGGEGEGDFVEEPVKAEEEPVDPEVLASMAALQTGATEVIEPAEGTEPADEVEETTDKAESTTARKVVKVGTKATKAAAAPSEPAGEDTVTV